MDNWNPLSVKVKESGEVMVIKDYKFDPELHEKVKGSKVVKEVVEECDEAVEEEALVEDGALICCGKEFKRAQDLKSHMTRMHS